MVQTGEGGGRTSTKSHTRTMPSSEPVHAGGCVLERMLATGPNSRDWVSGSAGVLARGADRSRRERPCC